MKLKVVGLVVSCLIFTATTHADSTQEIIGSLVKDVKPGLWEVKQKTAVDGQELPDINKMLEKVPPEMRAQVEAMMEKKAARLVSGKPMQVCLTKEQLEKQAAENDPENRCQFNDIQRNGNVTRVKVQCSKPKAKGETTITRLNAEAWTSATQMMVEEQGSAHAVNSEADARWVSADCGDIKTPEQQQATLTKEQRAEQRAAAAKILEAKLKEESGQ